MKVPFYPQYLPHGDAPLEGFDSFEEMKFWEKKACGIVCLKMILEAFTGQQHTVGELLKCGLDLQAYSEKGWIHEGLARIGRLYGLEGQAHRHAGFKDIAVEAGEGHLCMASVTPRFTFEPVEGVRYGKGGHLVVVVDVEGQDLIVHHPSFHPDFNWPGLRISAEEFENYFSGNFISFWMG